MVMLMLVLLRTLRRLRQAALPWCSCRPAMHQGWSLNTGFYSRFCGTQPGHYTMPSYSCQRHSSLGQVCVPTPVSRVTQ